MTRRALLQAMGAQLVSKDAIFETIPAGRSGIHWVHDNGRSPNSYMPETVGAGCAFLDYDNDGWMDIFLVNSGPCDLFQPKKPLRHALYRNNRNGTFTDVTESAGLHKNGSFGMGVAAADYDNDGFTDLYITGYGSNFLYHNNGDGTFTDVTARAGVSAPGWSTSAVWFDYDNDGLLDLFVRSFVRYGPGDNEKCRTKEGKLGYCFPQVYEGRASFLFHNNGDGTFTETGHLTDIGKSLGKSHGVVATDINNDGLLDLFAANDTMPNFLFVNRGGGKFEEMGLASGLAYGEDGNARAGMGVDSADFDNDGRMDLFVANVDHERFSIYHNDGAETFTDYARKSEIGSATRMLSGWGLKFFDYDNDGNEDLILANGHPDPLADVHEVNVSYREPLLLFHNSGHGFENVSSHGGEAFGQLWTARGLAVGDFDNDGGVDVLISNNGGAPLLLHNRVGAKNNWLGVRLIGKNCNREAVGARVTWSFGNVRRTRLKTAGGSFLSSHDPRMVLGAGPRNAVDRVQVQWPLPSGRVEQFEHLPRNTYVTLREGSGAL